MWIPSEVRPWDRYCRPRGHSKTLYYLIELKCPAQQPSISQKRYSVFTSPLHREIVETQEAWIG